MDLKEIKELVQVVIDSGVAELEVTRGDSKVRIRRQVEAPRQEIVIPQPMAVAGQPAAAPGSNPAPAAPSEAPAQAQPKEKDEEENLHFIKSPIVGTFYEAPAPDADPFVQVGDHISPGQVLCIIESMKLMNEIEAEVSGTIVAKLVENGKPVEYGQALFSVRPD